MTQDELKLVLDALKWCHGGEPCGTAEAIVVVEKALAQPEQEPVEWPRTMERGALVQWLHLEMVQHTLDEGTIDKLIEDAQAIPATPPQRTWVGLTQTEVVDLLCEYNKLTGNVGWQQLIYMTEAKLKEKNNG